MTKVLNVTRAQTKKKTVEIRVTLFHLVRYNYYATLHSFTDLPCVQYA